MEQNKKQKLFQLLFPIPFFLMMVDAWSAITSNVQSICYFLDDNRAFGDVLKELLWFGGRGYYLLFWILVFASFGVMVYCVLAKKKTFLLLVGPAVLTVIYFVNFVVTLFDKDTIYFGHDMYMEPALQGLLRVLFTLPTLIKVLVPLTLLAIVGVTLIKKENKIVTIAKKLWFVPAVVIVLMELLTLIFTLVCVFSQWLWSGMIWSYQSRFFTVVYSIADHLIYVVIFILAVTAFAVFVHEPFKKECVEETVEEAVEETVSEEE